MKDTFTIKELNEIYAKKGYGRRIGFGTKPAILVIDFTKGFTGKKGSLACDLVAPVQQTLKILTVARKARIPIIFTNMAYEVGLANAGLWCQKIPLESLVVGSEAVEIDPILQRQTNEPLLSKKYASAFFGTDLTSRLNAQRVDTVIITGCSTSGCVRATAVDAISYGFRVTVVEDAVGDRAELTHLVNLADIDAKYGDVVSTTRALEYLASLR